jgi:copper chaperone CopZ
MYQIEVENIKCGGCANSIEKALLKIKGVDAVKVNIENGTIAIVGDAAKPELLAKLTEIGYPEKGNNTVFCQAKSYLSCAVGKFS